MKWDKSKEDWKAGEPAKRMSYVVESSFLYLNRLHFWLFNREIRKRKANWIGHILHRNCLLQRVIEGKIQGWIEVTGRQGRRRRKLLDDLKGRGGYSHLKEEALDRTLWRASFGKGFGPVVRQTAKWIRNFKWWIWIPWSWSLILAIHYCKDK
jgi:hypothetical protein